MTNAIDTPSGHDQDVAGGEPVDSPRFFVVGVGASAGGLEALERLFDGLGPGCGMAFVVVQHLSPDFESVMDELLARRTDLECARAVNGMEVLPDVIYLMPPRAEMIISGGRILLTDRDPEQGLSLPIDVFLRSLAEDLGQRAVAVILSGSGSDGSRGVRAVHDAGGLVVVQSEETARFDGMPRSAIDTGIVDLILSPEEIRAALLRYAKRPVGDAAGFADAGVTDASDAMGQIFDLLRKESGIDFSHYKAGTVARRIERRLLLSRVGDLDEYVRQLRENPAELASLYKDLLIGVTGFFRDREAFARLGDQVIPELVDRLGPEEDLRIWCAACATGEEAYSLALLAHEAFRQAGRPPKLKVFATDVHRISLEIAGAGSYPAESMAALPEELRERYFSPIGDRYQVSAALRASIVFAHHNVLRDAPFTRLDLITCRNLLIYFKPVAQRKAVSLFLFGLKAAGVLVLGPSETPGSLGDEFLSVDGRWKMYRKRREIRIPPEVRMAGLPGERGVGTRFVDRRGPQERSIARAQQTLLERFAPPSLLVTPAGDLVHSFNGGGRYLTYHDGSPSLHILDLLGGELKFAAAAALKRATRGDEAAIFDRVPARTVDGPTAVRLTVTAVAGGDDEGRLLLTMEPVAEIVGGALEGKAPVDDLARERIETLEQDLRQTKENLQATVEEMETSNEELQATNEELIASNEELQSTNEELQSVNEELYTVNAEYQAKIAELTELTTDMNHLLESTEVQIIFLDQELRIRRLTPKIAETFNLLPQDVGRKIESFTHKLRHDGLVSELEGVLAGVPRVEREVQDARGCWYLMRVLPYRPRQTVEGVVLTLVDISMLKETERDLRASEERSRRQEEELRVHLKRRDDFLAMLSHELRNPLAAVLNATYALGRRELEEGASRGALDVINRQALHMARLLDDLLDVTRITLGKIEIRAEPLDLRAAAEAALQAVRPLVESKQLHLSADLDTGPVAVSGDLHRLQQVQSNMLTNAAKFTEPGGKVWLSVHREGREAVIRVRDSGVGLPPEDLDRVFELFYQRETTLDRSSGGIGVGLSLVRAVVELHGGRVFARSEGAGRGSEFVAVLPLWEGELPSSAPRPLPPEDEARRLSIFVVEDSDDGREMLEILLSHHGHAVEGYSNGAEGAAAIVERRPDMALVDIGLPGINGYEVAQRVRRDCEDTPIYLVALTGYGRPEDQKAALAAGFDEHVVKPIRPEVLTRLVEAVAAAVTARERLSSRRDGIHGRAPLRSQPEAGAE
ncbi:MAG TPA: chemotaxis protein CheB [Candidatus Nanopelagicales bacterium]|nr:chemotaxis protein CheB [Candidatus Nanopelagicales bacterium]